jgi:hypothetical protein
MIIRDAARIAHDAPVLTERRITPSAPIRPTGSPRHCEPTGRANARPMTGSAKQSIFQFAEAWIASSLALLAMTGLCRIQLSNSERMCVRILAARCARALRRFSPSRRTRGRRESRMRAAPAVSCAKCTKESAHEHTGSAENIRPSLRNGFTAYNALSPVNGLCCHRRHADRSTRLDASVGASGPHDFAVRVSHARQSQHLRPPHPTARS